MQPTFLLYLTNTAAAVRMTGVEKLESLAALFGNDWVISDCLPAITKKYGEEKIGYNYRICCIYSLAALMKHMSQPQVTQHVIPVFVKEDHLSTR